MRTYELNDLKADVWGGIAPFWMNRVPQKLPINVSEILLEKITSDILLSNLHKPVEAACYINELVDGKLKDHDHGGFSLPDAFGCRQLFTELKRKKDKITIFLYNLHLIHPILNKIKDSLHIPFEWRAYDVGATISVPSSTIGFHADDKDVIIFQTQGRRRWRVWSCDSLDSQYKADLMMQGDISPKRPAPVDGQPLIEIDLNPGEMLYIPALYPHEGVTQKLGDSVSISFSWIALSPWTFLRKIWKDLPDPKKALLQSSGYTLYQPFADRTDLSAEAQVRLGLDHFLQVRAQGVQLDDGLLVNEVRNTLQGIASFQTSPHSYDEYL